MTGTPPGPRRDPPADPRTAAGPGGDPPADPGGDPPADPRTGLTVVHTRYVAHAHAHYAGNLVDGAFTLGLFGDVATELCIRADGDEGLLAGYADVRFHAAVRGGDVLRVTGRLAAVGRRSRVVDLVAVVTCRGRPDAGAGAARVLAPPVVAVTATATVVVPG